MWEFSAYNEKLLMCECKWSIQIAKKVFVEEVACEGFQGIIDNQTPSYRIFEPLLRVNVSHQSMIQLQGPVASVSLKMPCVPSVTRPPAASKANGALRGREQLLAHASAIFFVPLILLFSNMYPTPIKVDSTTKR